MVQNFHLKFLLQTGVDPTKLFFFGNEDFFRFLLLSLAVVQYRHFFHIHQTLKLKSKNRKTGKMKVWYDWLQAVWLHKLDNGSCTHFIVVLKFFTTGSQTNWIPLDRKAQNVIYSSACLHEKTPCEWVKIYIFWPLNMPIALAWDLSCAPLL